MNNDNESCELTIMILVMIVLTLKLCFSVCSLTETQALNWNKALRIAGVRVKNIQHIQRWLLHLSQGLKKNSSIKRNRVIEE